MKTLEEIRSFHIYDRNTKKLINQNRFKNNYNQINPRKYKQILIEKNKLKEEHKKFKKSKKYRNQQLRKFN